MFSDIRRVARGIAAEPVDCGQYAIPANGARQTVYAPFILGRLKSARAIRYTRVYRESDDDLPGPVPGEAVGPGCPVASAAEMKELIYLPESYNSLSTCIHTLSLMFLAGPLFPVPPRSSATLGSFSFLPLSSSCRLRPYQPYLNFSPYPPASAVRLGGYSPFALSAPFSHGCTCA